MVGIRRLIDARSDTISFQRLLLDIQKRCNLVTRKGYIRRYPKWMQSCGIADEHFDDLAGAGSHHLPPSIPKKDIANMLLRAKKVKDFVNKYITHSNRKRARPRTLRTTEIDDALDVIDDTSVKYYLLLTGSYLEPRRSDPFDSEWKNIFCSPWIGSSS